MEAVQNAHAESSEANEEYIGKDDTVKGDGLVPASDAVLSIGKGCDDLGGEDNTEDGDDGEDERESPEEAIGKIPEFFRVALAHVGSENGDKRGGDGAFGNEATCKIGDTISEDEGVGEEGSTKKE